MIKQLLFISVGLIAAVVLGFVAIISVQPDEYLVQRAVVINASPDVVFAQLNDLQAWNAWSPWKDLDPQAHTTVSEPSVGEGATISWKGNDQIGEGTLTIVKSKQDQLLDLEQVFVRPMQDKANMTFTLIPDEDGTQLVWKLQGEQDFVEKAVCLFMDMDSIVGEKFEQGLVSIRDIAEGNGVVPVQTVAETTSDS